MSPLLSARRRSLRAAVAPLAVAAMLLAGTAPARANVVDATTVPQCAGSDCVEVTAMVEAAQFSGVWKARANGRIRCRTGSTAQPCGRVSDFRQALELNSRMLVTRNVACGGPAHSPCPTRAPYDVYFSTTPWIPAVEHMYTLLGPNSGRGTFAVAYRGHVFNFGFILSPDLVF